MRKFFMSLAMAVGSLLFAQDVVVHLSGFEWAYMDYGDGVCITYAAVQDDTTLAPDYTLTLPETLDGKPVVAIVTEALAGGYNNPFDEDYNPNWNNVTRIVFPKTLTALVSFDWWTGTFTDSYPTSPLGMQLYNPRFEDEPQRTKPITLAFQGPALENLECPPWLSVEYGEDYWDALCLETPHLLELPTDVTCRQQWESAIKRKTFALKEGEDEVTWNGLKVKDFVPNLDETIEEIADYFTECKTSTDAVGGKVCDALATLIKLQGNKALRKVATDSGFLKVSSAGVWTVSSFDIEKLDTQPKTVIDALVSSSVLGEFETAIELLEAVTPSWAGCVALKPADAVPLRDTLYLDAVDALALKASLEAFVSKLLLLSSYNLKWDYSQPVCVTLEPMKKISSYATASWRDVPATQIKDGDNGDAAQLQIANINDALVLRVTLEEGAFPSEEDCDYWLSTTIECSSVYWENAVNGGCSYLTVVDGSLIIGYENIAPVYQEIIEELGEDGLNISLWYWDYAQEQGGDYFFEKPQFLDGTTIWESQKDLFNGRNKSADLKKSKSLFVAACNTAKQVMTALMNRSDDREHLLNLDTVVTIEDIATATHAIDEVLAAVDSPTRIAYGSVSGLVHLAPLFTLDGPQREHFPKIVDGEFVEEAVSDPTYCGILPEGNLIRWTYSIYNDEMVGEEGVHIEAWDNDDISYKAAIAQTTSGQVTIPEMLGDKPVVVLGNAAFKDCARITSVVIPDTVQRIGENVFDGCTELKSITFVGQPPRLTNEEELLPGVVGYYMAEYASDWEELLGGATGTWKNLEMQPYVDPSRTESLVAASFDETRGKVSGAGLYKIGKSVKLTAKANKGYVFAGWYEDAELTKPCDSSAVDYRNTSYTCTAELTDTEVYARFIPAEEDVAAITFTLPEEYAAGVVIKPVAVDVSGCTSLPKVTVKGLPAGLKFDAKTFTITGTPTKSGVYTVTATVTTAGKSTATDTQNVIVRKEGEAFLLASGDAVEGKVTGSGVFASGKKVTLKATANKGYVFAGWYQDAEFETPCDSTTVDYRNPSYSYIMGETDKLFYARFIPAEEDEAAITFTLPAEYAAGEVIDLVAVDVSGCTSLPKVTVKGLPAGLKFTAKALTVKATKTTEAYEVPANTIYGTPTKSGVYTVTATVTTAGKSTDICTQNVIVRKEGEAFLLASGDAVEGKVTGSGVFASGKKVTLKATANKGYVFAGWYQDAEFEIPCDSTTVDYRNPSYTYIMGETDKLFYARFIPAEEDVAAITFTLPAEYAAGEVIDLVAVDVSGCTSLPKVTVKGLPAGLKFTAKALTVKATKTTEAYEVPANTIYGTPTKSGVYTVTATVTTAGKSTDICTQNVIVRKEGEAFLLASGDAVEGKVTGSGVFASGKKVTLKATANKGYVFAGWYEDAEFEIPCDSTTVDYRNPSYTYIADGADKHFYARFVTKEEDAEKGAQIILLVEGSDIPVDNYTSRVGEDIAPISVTVDSYSLPKVTVKGLPSGLKFDAKNFTITGTPKKKGDYTVTITAKTSGGVTETKTAVFSIAEEEVVLEMADEAWAKQEFIKGIALDDIYLTIGATSSVKSVKASSLPAGLKVVNDEGVWKIIGTPTKPGDYDVTLTMTTAMGTKQTLTIEMTVNLLPSWAIGKFSGDVENVWWEGDQEYYAYGTADVEVAEDGYLVGRFDLWDEGSVTYADIETKATVTLNEDGSYLLKFKVTAYTDYIYEDVHYREGTFTFYAVIDESGGLAISYFDSNSYVLGTLQKEE